jgi:uncharacterized protein YecT (DUF1311 family)
VIEVFGQAVAPVEDEQCWADLGGRAMVTEQAEVAMGRMTIVGFVVVLFALMFVRTSAAASAEAGTCAGASNQLELTDCAAQGYKKADAKLNQVYRSLVTSLDQEHQVKLKAAQRAWIAFRDAECDLEASYALHGSMEGQLRYMCLEGATTSRIKDLNNLRETLKDYIQ